MKKEQGLLKVFNDVGACVMNVAKEMTLGIAFNAAVAGVLTAGAIGCALGMITLAGAVALQVTVPVALADLVFGAACLVGVGAAAENAAEDVSRRRVAVKAGM